MISRILPCLLALSFGAPACDFGPEKDDPAAGSDDADASSEDTSGCTDHADESDGSDGSQGSAGSVGSGGSDEGSAGSSGEPSDTPPELTVVTPSMDLLGDEGPVYDDYDAALGLWFVDVDVAATATDAEDGDLAASVEWTTDRDDIQDAALGTGGAVSVRLYSDLCTGTLHTLQAEVTDADGNTVTAERQLFIWMLC